MRCQIYDRHETQHGGMCQSTPIGHDTPYGHRVLPGPDQYHQEVHHQRDHGSQVCQEDLAENIANMSTKWCYEVLLVTLNYVARSRLVEPTHCTPIQNIKTINNINTTTNPQHEFAWHKI